MATNNWQEYRGLSTETKPTHSLSGGPGTPLNVGDTFTEIDTGTAYDWNGTAWIVSLISTGGGGGGGSSSLTGTYLTADPTLTNGATAAPRIDVNQIMLVHQADLAASKDFVTVVNAGTFAVQATLAAGATAIAKSEDSASADADVGVPTMAVRRASPANSSGTDGDYEFLQVSAGRLWCSSVIDTALPAGTNTIGAVNQAKGTKANSAVAPSTTAAQCLAANATRIKALIYNNGTQTVYLGPSSGVTTASGMPLPAGGTLTDTTSTTAWFAITASGSGDLRIIEVSGP